MNEKDLKLMAEKKEQLNSIENDVDKLRNELNKLENPDIHTFIKKIIDEATPICDKLFSLIKELENVIEPPETIDEKIVRANKNFRPIYLKKGFDDEALELYAMITVLRDVKGYTFKRIAALLKTTINRAIMLHSRATSFRMSYNKGDKQKLFNCYLNSAREKYNGHNWI